MGAAAAIAGGVAVAGLAGSVIQGQASKDAAKTQASAANNAAAVQQHMFDTTQANLQPYNQAGQNNLDAYSNWYKVTADQAGNAFNLAQNALPQQMTQANLEKTPGYQFNLSQGLRAVQNSNAARGLGVSGAALQGAGTYATGLADSTYQNQFNNQQTMYSDAVNQANLKLNQLNSIYNQIGGVVGIGENAAASAGNNAVQSGANIGNSLTNAGIAQSAGITGQANAMASGINSIGNAGMTYLGMQNALQGSGGGGQQFTDTGTF